MPLERKNGSLTKKPAIKGPIDNLFFDLDDARAKIAAWIADDRRLQCPATTLITEILNPPGPMPPTSPQRTTGYATPTSFADRPLLHPRHLAYTNSETLTAAR